MVITATIGRQYLVGAQKAVLLETLLEGTKGLKGTSRGITGFCVVSIQVDGTAYVWTWGGNVGTEIGEGGGGTASHPSTSTTTVSVPVRFQASEAMEGNAQRGDLEHGAHPFASGGDDPTAPQRLKSFKLSHSPGVFAREAVAFATSPNIDFVPPGGELRDHAQWIVRGTFPAASFWHNREARPFLFGLSSKLSRFNRPTINGRTQS